MDRRGKKPRSAKCGTPASSAGKKVSRKKKEVVEKPKDKIERQKYLCPFDGKKFGRPGPFAKHYMSHTKETYSVCTGCGGRKEKGYKPEWTGPRHGCHTQGTPYTIKDFSRSPEVLRRSLAELWGLQPLHIPTETVSGPAAEAVAAPPVADLPVADPPVDELPAAAPLGADPHEPYPPVEEEGEEEPILEEVAEEEGPMVLFPWGDTPVPRQSNSRDAARRYPIDGDGLEDQPTRHEEMQVLTLSPEARIYTDPQTGSRRYRVPAVHRRTGLWCVLTGPADLGSVGLIFEALPIFACVPVDNSVNRLRGIPTLVSTPARAVDLANPWQAPP